VAVVSRRGTRVQEVGDDGMLLVAGTLDVGQAKAAALEWLRTDGGYTTEEATEVGPWRLRSPDAHWWRWVPTDPQTREGGGYRRMLHPAEPHARGAFPAVTFG
jgi:hypothetical protein